MQHAMRYMDTTGTVFICKDESCSLLPYDEDHHLSWQMLLDREGLHLRSSLPKDVEGTSSAMTTIHIDRFE